MWMLKKLLPWSLSKMAGLWADADEANAESLKQIEQTKGGKMAAGFTNVTSKPVKRWQDMTDAEQKADIAARIKEREEKSKTTPSSPVVKGGYVEEPYKKCIHDGCVSAFTMFDKKYWFAGAQNFEVKAPPVDTILVLDLAGSIKFETRPWVVTTPPELAHLKTPPPKPPPYMKLDWPDRSEPQCELEWWAELLTSIQKAWPEGGRVIISCMGAHGRTGTAMAAIILSTNPQISCENAIKFVRKQHCEKAIESDDQVEYLRLFRPKEKSKFLDDAGSDAKLIKTWIGQGYS